MQQGKGLPAISGIDLERASKNKCSHVLADMELHLNSLYSVGLALILPCLIIMNKFSFSVRLKQFSSKVLSKIFVYRYYILLIRMRFKTAKHSSLRHVLLIMHYFAAQAM